MHHSSTGYELSSIHQAELRQEVAENRLARQGADTALRERGIAPLIVERVVLVLRRTFHLRTTSLDTMPARKDTPVSIE